MRPPASASSAGPAVGVVAEQVFHRHRRPSQRRRSQRQAADGADVVLELRGRGALDRPVPRIVNARRHLVEHRAIRRGEELAREARRHARAARPPRRASATASAGPASAPPPTPALSRSPAPRRQWTFSGTSHTAHSPSAPRASSHREFREEIDSRFQNCGMAGGRLGRPADRCPRRLGIGGRVDPRLPLAVIAEQRRLQDRRRPDRRDRRVQPLPDRRPVPRRRCAPPSSATSAFSLGR